MGDAVKTGGNGRYRMILFVAGGEPNSALARRNLSEICSEHLPEGCDLEEVDVLTDATLALEHNVVVTPALLLLEPAPPILIAGSLQDREKVLAALRFNRASFS